MISIWTDFDGNLNKFPKDLNEFHPNLKFTYEKCKETVNVLNLVIKWHQRDSNPKPFSSYTSNQSFSQRIQLFCEYLSVRCIWLYAIIMLHTRSIVKLHSIVGWNLATIHSCCYFNFSYRACFEQGNPWHSGNYRMWLHSETGMWHDNNLQSNSP